MRNWLPLLALLVALLAVPARAASVYGDIEISMAPEPRGNNNHGYSEYLFYVQNKGDRPRTAAKQAPAAIRLEQPDLVADRRRRHGKLRRGPLEAAVARRAALQKDSRH